MRVEHAKRTVNAPSQITGFNFLPQSFLWLDDGVSCSFWVSVVYFSVLFFWFICFCFFVFMFLCFFFFSSFSFFFFVTRVPALRSFGTVNHVYPQESSFRRSPDCFFDCFITIHPVIDAIPEPMRVIGPVTQTTARTKTNTKTMVRATSHESLSHTGWSLAQGRSFKIVVLLYLLVAMGIVFVSLFHRS